MGSSTAKSTVRPGCGAALNRPRLTRAALLLVCALVGACPAQGRGARRVPSTNFTPELAQQIAATAITHGLDPLLVLEIMRQESAFNPQAGSGKGARGLMQLMPATAARFGISNALDPQQAITGGCRYLRYLSDLFGAANTALILAAYNAGETAVERYGRRIPPYPETQNYVNLIAAAYARAVALRAQVAARRSWRGHAPVGAAQVNSSAAAAAHVRDAEVLALPLGSARRLATTRPH